jgi:hypothetical protein
VVERFKRVDLHPDAIDNPTMRSRASSSARSGRTCPTPGSTPTSATPATARSAWSATRSTSTATSTATPHPARSGRSRPGSARSSGTSCGCWLR